MKKNLLFLFALISTVCLFSSCSKDDDGNNNDGNNDGGGQSAVEQIVGVYGGSMDINLILEGTPVPVANDLEKDITVSKYSDNAITMELKSLEVPLVPGTDPISLGDIKMENCPVNSSDSGVLFSSTQDMEVNMVGLCTVSVNGVVQNGKLTMPIDVVVKEGGLNVKVQYEGTKK